MVVVGLALFLLSVLLTGRAASGNVVALLVLRSRGAAAAAANAS